MNALQHVVDGQADTVDADLSAPRGIIVSALLTLPFWALVAVAVYAIVG